MFAIDGMGTRVAMVELTEGPPQLLLAGHLEGDRPVLVYRVGDLAVAAGTSRRAAGRRITRSRSRKARSARSLDRAATGSRSTS